MPADVTPLRPQRAGDRSAAGIDGEAQAAHVASRHGPSRPAGHSAVAELRPRRQLRLASLVGAVEETFCPWQRLLIERLADVDTELEALAAGRPHEALEQSAFIRVGLRCIADAIAELAAHTDALGTEASDASFNSMEDGPA